MRSCEVDRLSQAGVVSTYRICGGCDLAEIVDVLGLDVRGVECIGEPGESLSGSLYFLV